MPVTARLSKAFYDRLGEEIVNELVEWFNLVDATYRSDLREINELNYARFDAKVEQRMVQLEAKLEQRMTQLEAKLDQRMVQLEAKLDQRIAQLDAKIDRVVAELRSEFASGLHALRDDLHRELRDQTRFIIGVLTALWMSLLIPIVGLWMR